MAGILAPSGVTRARWETCLESLKQRQNYQRTITGNSLLKLCSLMSKDVILDHIIIISMMISAIINIIIICRGVNVPLKPSSYLLHRYNHDHHPHIGPRHHQSFWPGSPEKTSAGLGKIHQSRPLLFLLMPNHTTSSSSSTWSHKLLLPAEKIEKENHSTGGPRWLLHCSVGSSCDCIDQLCALMGNEHTAHITSASNEENFIQQFGCLLTTDREPNHTLRDWRRSWTTTCKSFRSLSTCPTPTLPLCRSWSANKIYKEKAVKQREAGLG